MKLDSWRLRKSQKVRVAVLGAVGCALPLAAMLLDKPSAHAADETSGTPDPDLLAEVFRNGEAGFVVTQFAYALGPDAAGSNACPTGMTGGVRGLIEALRRTPEGQRRADESDRAYERRLSMTVNTAPDGRNLCMNPDAVGPDAGWRMVSGDVAVGGIDLDGADSRGTAGGKDASCRHQDFRGAGGERGIDNQFYRVVGCAAGFQSNGAANGFQTEMYTGSWGIVVTLKGVENPQNDPSVEVGIHANADPLQLSASRTALPFATYAAEQDPRYRAVARGRISNGVLTTDPVDVRFVNVVNSMREDRVLRDARLRLTLTRDGGLEGYLGGYTPVDSMYDVQFGVRHSRNAKGELAPERMRIQTSVGRAGALGYSCHGAYHAMLQAADGHRDPATGRCNSISTQYRIRMIPAFIVEARTQSVNAPLTLR